MTRKKAIELLKRIVGPSTHDKEWSCVKGDCERCKAIDEAAKEFHAMETKAIELERMKGD